MYCIQVTPLHDCDVVEALCVVNLLVVTWHLRVCFRETDSGVEVSTHHEAVATVAPVSAFCFK